MGPSKWKKQNTTFLEKRKYDQIPHLKRPMLSLIVQLRDNNIGLKKAKKRKEVICVKVLDITSFTLPNISKKFVCTINPPL